MKRALFWAGVLVGALLLVGGVVVAALGLAATASPASVVRSYFAALSHGDAAQALAYGNVPSGPRLLLTSDVLDEQQRIAALHDVSVLDTRRHGSHAVVSVSYRLAFPRADVAVSDDVALHKSSGNWRLDATAVATELNTPAARQRESILGAPLPRGRTLLFPGALPVRLDTPYLALAPHTDHVAFDSPPAAFVDLVVTPAGRAALTAAVRQRLRNCLTVSRSAACPLPTERFIPGSLSGRLDGALQGTSITVTKGDPVGSLRLDAKAPVVASYRRLNFHNRAIVGHGRVELEVQAVAYAVPPLRVTWVGP